VAISAADAEVTLKVDGVGFSPADSPLNIATE
jgi:hypothetical protein